MVLFMVPGHFGPESFRLRLFRPWVISTIFRCLMKGCSVIGFRTTRPKDKSTQDNSAQDSLAQVVPISEDNSAQVVPISEDNSAQITQTAEDHSAHKNQTRHLSVYLN